MKRRHFAKLLLPWPALAARAPQPEWLSRIGGSVETGKTGEIVAVKLSGTWVNDSELLDLAALPSLERLDLSHTRISDEGLLYLRPAKRIRELNLLYAEQITDQGMNAIKQWSELRSLNVRGTRIGDGTMAVASGLPQIESLDVTATAITENGLDSLISLVKLKRLEMGRNRLREDALVILRLVTDLEWLDLSGPRSVNRNQRSDANAMGAALVEAIGELSHLRVLKLGHLTIDADGLKTLAGKLGKVERLGLELGPRIDDACLPVLASWKSLKHVDLQETAVTPAALQKLQEARPDLHLLTGPFPVA
jgi:hypothetical protein